MPLTALGDKNMFGTLKFLNQPLPLTHPIVDCLTLQENRVTQKVHRQIWETCWMDWRQYRSGRGPAVSRDAQLHFSSDHCENFNNMHSALCRLTNQFLYSCYSEWCIYVVCSTPTSPFSPNLQLCGDWLCDPLRYSVDKWRVTALSGNTQPPMELSYSQPLTLTN